jgi:serine/threonine-protein kinase
MKLDRYEFVRRVAAGGMGAIWLARLTGKHGFEKRVAIKTILPEFSSDSQFRTMFLEEARVASHVAHANVAQVLDVGEAAGVLYIVFEWVDGVPLERLCSSAEKTGRGIPLGFVLGALGDVCAGIHAAHELGIVHRDVTPQNVLVADDGFAKLIDFGIAKARDRLCAATKSGLVRGRPEYMSPEQAIAARVDRRADVWSAGAVLHRAVLGRPPFRHQQEHAEFILGKRLIELPPETPSDVRPILVRALARSRDDRYATADEMRVAIRSAAHAHADHARVTSFVRDVMSAATPVENASQQPTLREGPGAASVEVDPDGDGSARRVRESDPWRFPLRVALVLALIATVLALAFALATLPS